MRAPFSPVFILQSTVTGTGKVAVSESLRTEEHMGSTRTRIS